LALQPKVKPPGSFEHAQCLGGSLAMLKKKKKKEKKKK
jgi:hypothetical protein